MPANEVLQEAKKLHKVGDSLEVLADQNPPIEEALTVILGKRSQHGQFAESGGRVEDRDTRRARYDNSLIGSSGNEGVAASCERKAKSRLKERLSPA